MPENKEYPFIQAGSLLQGHMPEMQGDTYGFYLAKHKAHGDSLCFKAYPGINFYSFVSPDAVHHVLTKARKKYSKGKLWSYVVSFIGGKGIVTSEGELWQKQRQAIVPYFQPTHVEKYAERIIKNTLALMERGKKLPEGTEINVSQAMMSLGLINISDMLFDYDISEKAETFSDAMMDGFFYINRFVQNPLTCPRFIPTETNRRFKEKKAIADAIVTEIIEAVRKKDGDCMISALIKANNSDKQLHDEIMTLLMAGHDTLSTALSWTWYLLARNPDVLKKLQDELDTELKGVPPTAASLEKLTYTRMVFKETLRLYPSAWAIHRVADEDDEIDGYTVRKNSSVVLPLYVTHRHPAYWKYPDQFYPEHFSDGESAGRPRFAYAPFGAGERVCIGGHLATIEGMLILAAILQKFTPKLKDDKEIKPLVNFTLKPERDIIGIAVQR